MENIIEADFKVVQERTLDIIATEIKTIDNHVCQVALNGAIEIGAKLEEAKEKVGHGNWENWCKENLDYSKSQAERFMKISAEYGNEDSPYLSAISKTYTCTDFSISKAFRLLQVPENEIEDFVEKNDVDTMKVRELENEIKRLKQEKETADEQLENIDRLQSDLDTAMAEKEATAKLLQDLQEKQKKAENGELPDDIKAEMLERQNEIDKLKESLDKSKAKEKKLKEEKDRIEASRKEAIQEAEKKARDEAAATAQAEAEKVVADTIEQLEKETEEAKTRAAAAENMLAMSASEEVVIFKTKTADLQKMVGEIKTSIHSLSEKDPEQADKHRQVFKKVMQALYDGI
ncbi:DUF3102 domain-containing protein [Aminipila butyrica]|uniref:DUF3102 domain-containing protein n=1 Tax=Aminipila butyrica TaxID=433296 RepID=A0A858BU38_9FIRM|nr:DUF3102 domain-containing protein [Aminipila butyrica]QIB68595.1 DUF3102 domain-containing protein [Aminipila butyrica]